MFGSSEHPFSFPAGTLTLLVVAPAPLRVLRLLWEQGCCYRPSPLSCLHLQAPGSLATSLFLFNSVPNS